MILENQDCGFQEEGHLGNVEKTNIVCYNIGMESLLQQASITKIPESLQVKSAVYAENQYDDSMSDSLAFADADDVVEMLGYFDIDKDAVIDSSERLKDIYDIATRYDMSLSEFMSEIGIRIGNRFSDNFFDRFYAYVSLLDKEQGLRARLDLTEREISSHEDSGNI